MTVTIIRDPRWKAPLRVKIDAIEIAPAMWRPGNFDWLTETTPWLLARYAN